MLPFIPDEVLSSNTDVWGDWDKFFESLESGYQAQMYDMLIALNASVSDIGLRGELNGAIIPGCC